MPEPELSLPFIRPLNQLGIRYLVSGSVAGILYGEPRLTLDVDFVAFLRQEEVLKLQQAFPAARFYMPPLEIIAAEIARPEKGHFHLIHMDSGFKADFYTAGRNELHAWAFRNARHMQYRNESVVVAPPEYVIIRKLEYFREGGSDKHLRDIRAMLEVSGELIDRVELESWIKDRGLTDEWARASA